MNKCTICINIYENQNNVSKLLSNLLAISDKQFSQICIAVRGTTSEFIDIDTKYLLRMLELNNIECIIKDGFNNNVDMQRWFKHCANENILCILDDNVFLNADYFELLKEFNDLSVGAVGGCFYIPDYNSKYELTETPQISRANRIYLNSDTNLLSIADNYQLYYFKDRTKKFDCDCLYGSAFFIRNNCYLIDTNYTCDFDNIEKIDAMYNMVVHMGRRCVFSTASTAFCIPRKININKICQHKESSDYFIKKWDIKSDYETNFAVAVDFDNTITLNSTPNKTGTINPQAVKAIQCLKQHGCVLILWTAREGHDLIEARDLCEQNGLYFDYFNEYPLRRNTRKIDVDFMIDDRSVVQIEWENIIKYIIKKKQEKFKQNESNKNSKI